VKFNITIASLFLSMGWALKYQYIYSVEPYCCYCFWFSPVNIAVPCYMTKSLNFTLFQATNRGSDTMFNHMILSKTGFNVTTFNDVGRLLFLWQIFLLLPNSHWLGENDAMRLRDYTEVYPHLTVDEVKPMRVSELVRFRDRQDWFLFPKWLRTES